jgi:N-acetylmuramoyl-L-alanine amidase
LILFLLLGPHPVSVCASVREHARISVYGYPSIPVREWAQTRGLKTEWVVRDRCLEVSGGGNRIQFTLDSAEVVFNGTSVFLSHPVAARFGVFYISRLDVSTVIAPLLNPPRLPPGRKIKTICLDPGHGGKDPGNREGWFQEKKFTLLLAQELRSQLARLGYKVVMTRNRDEFLELDDRPARARQLGADLFISLHFNSTATGRDSVRGAETYCLTPAGASSTNARGLGAASDSYWGNANDDANLWLAFQIQKSLRVSLGTEDRGVRRARFAVLRGARMPAVLVEAGFMSHPREGRLIGSEDYRKQIARAVADAVQAYRKSVERPE